MSGYPCLTERPSEPGTFDVTHVSNIRKGDFDFLREHGVKMVMWPHWFSGFMVKLEFDMNGHEITVTESVDKHGTCEELVGKAVNALRDKIEQEEEV